MNIFTATMPVWIYLLSVAVLLLLIAYFAFVAARHDSMAESIAAEKQEQNDAISAKYATLKEESNKLAAKYFVATAELHKADETIEKQIDEITHLHAQLADRNEAVQEEKAKVKALQMQTIEAQSIEPEQVARYQTVLDAAKPAKRPPRKPKAQN